MDAYGGWRETAGQVLRWAELIAAAGVIAAAFSGAIGAGPTIQATASVALPVIVVTMRLLKAF